MVLKLCSYISSSGVFPILRMVLSMALIFDRWHRNSTVCEIWTGNWAGNQWLCNCENPENDQTEGICSLTCSSRPSVIGSRWVTPLNVISFSNTRKLKVHRYSIPSNPRTQGQTKSMFRWKFQQYRSYEYTNSMLLYKDFLCVPVV